MAQRCSRRRVVILNSKIKLWRLLLQIQATITFSIAPSQLAITNTSFSGQVGVPITGSLGITGGTPPYSVAVPDPSQLPPGVTLDATGTVGGVPTQSGGFSTGITIADAGQ